MSSSQSSPGYYNTPPSTSTTTANTAVAGSIFATRHPWHELIQPFSSFTHPYRLSEATANTNTAARSVFATCHPWHKLIQPFSSFMCPYTFGEATAHVKRNLDLSLLWHPISMIVFLAIYIAWSFLYFLCDRLLLFHITVDDRVILALLSIITIVALVLTDVWLNVIVSLTLG
ncbi:hypothetical protein CMV_007643 [Castanea mollissima]|uniref:PRA1 family protein n=1 Tax=Castanea mollissima TaxID=60419 RepID=A0A8J4R9S9_9ROSI|nr:hypothetical protein CMV_007643 [Castanea mollissima]